MKKFITHCTLFALTISTPNWVLAQSGNIDPTFNPGDNALNNGSAASGTVEAILPLPDGSIVIGGQFQFYNGQPRSRLCKLLSNGRLDTNFSIGGGANNTVHTLAHQNDGKIILGGAFTQYHQQSAGGLIRLHPNGEIDSSFQPGIGADNTIYATQLQSDGKLIIAGDFSLFDGAPHGKIVRLNSDGSIDPSFMAGIGASGGIISDIAIQPDGRIILVGEFVQFNGLNHRRIVRLMPNGSVDLSFTSGLGPNNPILDVELLTNNRILIGGSFTQYDGAIVKRIARLMPDGQLDSTFHLNPGTNSIVRDIAVQPDQKYVIVGHFDAFNGISRDHVARINSDGTIDTTFNPVYGTNNNIHCIEIQSDGRMLIGGTFTFYNSFNRNRFTRLEVNGLLDREFNQKGGVNGPVFDILIQPDSKILVAGDFTAYDGAPMSRIVRIKNNGVRDSTFTAAPGANREILCMALQTDGKIIIGGNFKTYNGLGRARLARLNANGTVDSMFISSANKYVKAIAIQSDGKILIGGGFSIYRGTSRRRMARLLTDGSVDLSFVPELGFADRVLAIHLQPNGKIIVGGQFHVNNNGITQQNIARLNVDGSLDTSFKVGAGYRKLITSITAASNGNLIVTGLDGMVILTPDGEALPEFDRLFGASYIVETAAERLDGSLLAGGSFVTYDGFNSPRIVGLLPTNQVDPNFLVGSGTNSTVHKLVRQADGRILMGGSFTNYNGTPKSGLIRLLDNGGHGFSTVFTEPIEVDCPDVLGRGRVVDDGGYPVTSRGICWRTNGPPTIFNSNIVSGSDTGRFQIPLSSLIPGTLYNLRAFSVNSIGVSYGSTLFFRYPGAFSVDAEIQQVPECAGGLGVIKATYSNSGGPKTILWSTGDTTKFIAVPAGIYHVTISDSVCSTTDTVDLMNPLNSEMAAMGLVVSKNGSQQFNANWMPPAPIPAGYSIIGYRLGYRLKGAATFSQTPLTTSLSATVDFTGLGLCNGNYEFTVFTRFRKNTIPTTSAPACFVSRGYSGGTCKAAEFVEGEEYADFDFTVYPNPTQGIVYVEAPAGTTLEVYDLRGSKLLEAHTQNGSHTLDLSAYSKGVYLLRLQSGERVETQRIMRE